MRLVFRLSFLLLVLFVSSGVTYSCTCGKPTFDEKLKISKTIFVGEVVEIKSIENAQNAIKFRVGKHWRGVTDSYITVISDWPVMCTGLPANVGEKYLIFAYDYKGQLLTVACMSPELKDAKKELRKLGKGKNVLSPTPPNNSFNASGITLIVIDNLDAIRRYFPPR